MMSFLIEIVELLTAGLMLASVLCVEKNPDITRQVIFNHFPFLGKQQLTSNKGAEMFGRSWTEVR